MQASVVSGVDQTLQETPSKAASDPAEAAEARDMPKVALLTAGYDRPYVYGLTHALAAEGVAMEVVGGDDIDSPDLRVLPNLKLLNLRGDKKGSSLATKVFRVISYYAKLIRYAAGAEPKILHILWNNKFEYFDRTLLMLYYKALGKKIVFTAHNVNAGKRDENDSLLNRLTLRVQYKLSDHIFVHTEKMKGELVQDFGIQSRAISVIPFGINNSLPNTALTPAEARSRLGLAKDEKVILFFGALREYKGLEYLWEGFLRLVDRHPEYRLIIAGERRKESGESIDQILQQIESSTQQDRVLRFIGFIPDEEAEIYFKAADILALPYTHIFQSGVLFTSYNFGLPVVASDVGSIREEIIEGETGYLCQPRDPKRIADALEKYFEGDLFRSLEQRRPKIQEWAAARHSWSVVGETTREVYAELLAN